MSLQAHTHTHSKSYKYACQNIHTYALMQMQTHAHTRVRATLRRDSQWAGNVETFAPTHSRSQTIQRAVTSVHGDLGARTMPPPPPITESSPAEANSELFQHVLVVGVPKDELTATATSAPMDQDQRHEPKILYQFPPKKPLNAEAVTDSDQRTLITTTSHESVRLLRILVGQSPLARVCTLDIWIMLTPTILRWQNFACRVVCWNVGFPLVHRLYAHTKVLVRAVGVKLR